MADVHCFTSASFSYLDRARILAETVKRYHPDWTLWLCLSDREPPGFTFDLHREPFDRLVRIEELGIPDLDRWMFGHDLVELCTAVKGPMLCHVLKSGAKKIIYLDPDIALFGTLDEATSLLDDRSVVLTPHQVEPDQTPAAILDNEICSLKHGIYNLGFIAVSSCEEGVRFAHWWRDRLMSYCIDDIPSGLFTDQRWCDLVPAFFPGTKILRNPGYNVASWNLSQRPIVIDREGMITAGGSTLRFFHFTKVEHVGAVMIERYAAGRFEVFELLHWYRRQLKKHKEQGIPPGWWAFKSFVDGTPITRECRRTYRFSPDLQARFPNPYDSTPDSYQAWYNTQTH